jgi:hypothetical protein
MDVLRLASLLEQLPPERTRLLDNLGRVRREVGPITPELSDALADRMSLRHGDVHEVVSFYSFLQVPVDAVRVCTGPVCDCAGSRGASRRTARSRCPCPRATATSHPSCWSATPSAAASPLDERLPARPDELQEPAALSRRGAGAVEASGLTWDGGAGFRPGASGTPFGASPRRAS